MVIESKILLNLPMSESHSKEMRIGFLILLSTFLTAFFIMAALFEKHKPKFGHETGAIVVVGVLFSLIFYWIHGDDSAFIDLYGFNSAFFFDLVLPPIVFNAGFNMRRRKFFQNLGNILILGLVVSFLSFIIYASSAYSV